MGASSHKRCAKIKVKKPNLKGIGLYNIEGIKRCTHCEIFTTDLICPNLRCPCCGLMFKKKQRWKTGCTHYGAPKMKSAIAYNEKIKRNAKIIGRVKQGRSQSRQ